MMLWEDLGVSFGWLAGSSLSSLSRVCLAAPQQPAALPAEPRLPPLVSSGTAQEGGSSQNWGAISSSPPPPRLWGPERGGYRESLHELGTAHHTFCESEAVHAEWCAVGPHLRSPAHVLFLLGRRPPEPHSATWGRRVLTLSLLPLPLMEQRLQQAQRLRQTPLALIFLGRGLLKGLSLEALRTWIQHQRWMSLWRQRKGPQSSHVPFGMRLVARRFQALTDTSAGTGPQ